MTRLVGLMPSAISVLPAFAGKADVLEVAVSCSSDSICRFDVTVRHDDKGWEHFANRWEILSPDGEVLAVQLPD